jgi:hypothetical protein
VSGVDQVAVAVHAIGDGHQPDDPPVLVIGDVLPQDAACLVGRGDNDRLAGSVTLGEDRGRLAAAGFGDLRLAIGEARGPGGGMTVPHAALGAGMGPGLPLRPSRGASGGPVARPFVGELEVGQVGGRVVGLISLHDLRLLNPMARLWRHTC